MKYTVIILAGGKGKRIKKFTTKKPKPLVEIFNKPFIEYQIDLIKKQKYKKIIISVGHYGNQIINFLKKKKFKDLNITFSKDGQKALGTGGALKKIFKNNKGNFIILYGDSYLPIDLEKVQTKFIHSKKDALLTIYKNQNRFDKSNIKIKNRKIL
jgi:NDP-sugar pyrophosphorylase family protein